MVHSSSPSQPPIHLCALGNTLVDTFVSVKDAIIAKHSLTKGGMHLIDTPEGMKALLEDVLPSTVPDEECLRQAGGSAGNVATFYARLGGQSQFIGAIGKDVAGSHFQKDMDKHGVEPTLFLDDKRMTGQCLVLITPDAQRTMCTYLGAGAFCDQSPTMIKKGFFYVEGYVWDSFSLKTTAHRLISSFPINKKGQSGFVLNLSDSLCVDRHREEFASLLPYVSLLSGNEQEVCALTQKANALDALRSLRERVPLTFMTAGSKGVFVADKHAIFHQTTACQSKVEDTTGAGDACIAGFLYGKACGYSHHIATWVGQKLSKIVITQQGTRPPIAHDFPFITQEERQHISDITAQVS